MPKFKFCWVFLILATTAMSQEVLKKSIKSKKKIKVFILAGQSNMEGRADGTKLLQEDHERLLRAQKNVQLAYNNEPLIPLNPVKPTPGIAETYNRTLIFGPEIFFGITLSEIWPDEEILLIKLSEGSTSLHGCWNANWSEDKAAIMNEVQESKLYSSLTNYIEQILSEYKTDEYELCGMLWVQGETDAGNKIAASAYGRNLNQFIGQIRQDLKKENLPFILFQVGHGKVVEGMIDVSKSLTNVTLIPQSLEPMSADFYSKLENGHYNYEGMKKLGERFAEVFLELYQE
jgi:hypothetical protein